MQKSHIDVTETIKTEKYAATREWIKSQQQCNDEIDDISNFDGEVSVISSIVESSTDYDTDNEANTFALGAQIAPSELTSITEGVKELFNSLNSVQTLGNVKIENSTGVHIGNVTNINGNIQIFHTGTSLSERPRLIKRKERLEKAKYFHSSSSNEELEEREERVSTAAFIDRSKFKIPRTLCSILPRHSWLAQCPMEEYEYLKEPVSYVVVSHTATESSEKRAINVRIVRDVQCFHIESRGWNDIGYNFLIGCDGNIYEGRGWGVVGAHTMGYNTSSIGISFIGCFMRELPSKAAMNVFKNLLGKGVEDGHLSNNYKLITHAQCCSTESPGRKLIEELQTWEHFYRIEDVEE